MKRLAVIAICSAALLSGCSENRPAEPSSAVASVTSKHAVLVDGYTPSFEHVLRSQRHEEDGGYFRHVVIVEHIGGDQQSIAETLRTDLEVHGFNVEGPVDHRGAARLIATKRGMRLTGDVHDEATIELNSAGAKGIVQFYWGDREPR